MRTSAATSPTTPTSSSTSTIWSPRITPARKPHVEFFAYAHQFALAEPDECLFVDDMPVNIETAEHFGWKGIVYRPEGTLVEKLKEHGVQLA